MRRDKVITTWERARKFSMHVRGDASVHARVFESAVVPENMCGVYIIAGSAGLTD